MLPDSRFRHTRLAARPYFPVMAEPMGAPEAAFSFNHGAI
jgi:hypothetical protein